MNQTMSFRIPKKLADEPKIKIPRVNLDLTTGKNFGDGSPSRDAIGSMEGFPDERLVKK